VTSALLWQAPLLVVVGAVAGCLNVIAGGGSLLTLPVLIFLGLPGATANGTNRIAIFCQNIFAINTFRLRGVFPLRLALWCTFPALVGSYIGAQLAVDISDELFRQVLGVIMIGVLLLTTFDPMKRWRTIAQELTPLRYTVLFVTFFGVGIYGGFVQAGVGFLIISALLVHGLDLVEINAIKVIVIFAFTSVALVIFIVHGQIDYSLGLSLAVGNSFGGWLGTHLSVSKGHSWIQRVVSVTVLVFAARLLLG